MKTRQKAQKGTWGEILFARTSRPFDVVFYVIKLNSTWDRWFVVGHLIIQYGENDWRYSFEIIELTGRSVTLKRLWPSEGAVTRSSLGFNPFKR